MMGVLINKGNLDSDAHIGKRRLVKTHREAARHTGQGPKFPLPAVGGANSTDSAD